MKTQLLEDIGQSATLSLVPSGRVSHHKAGDAAVVTAPARAAAPSKPRSAFGVWRQKPAGEPALSTQDQTPSPVKVPLEVEPIEASQAQQVYPQPIAEAAIPAAAEPAQQGPVFHFTPPSLTILTPAPDPVQPELTWYERSGPRYLKWGACVLSGALVVGAGLWFYDERKDAGALALVANEVKAEPAFNKAATQRALAAKEFTLGPDGEVRVAPAVPAASPVTVARSVPSVPPLVLLEPESAPDTKAQATPERVVERIPVAAPPKRVRPIERAPVIQAEKKSEQDAAMSVTLNACKEYGYTAAQCVKRACSVTKYGFVCRGK